MARKARVGCKLGGATSLDLSPDGKRFVLMTLVATPEAAKAKHEIVFLFNFFDELRRRVPVEK